ncbi:MAG TPA: hypothetical protein VF575_00590 [Candidatus Saccharimonadales bacterium]|jgi:hypothetical protein
MKLFGGKQSVEPQGRRPRTADDDAARRSNQAFSYYSQRSPEAGNTGRRDPTDMVSERRSQQDTSLFARHRSLSLVVLCLIVLALAYALSLSGRSKVILMEDAATAYFLQDANIYQQSVQQTLGQSIFNRNKLTINSSSVRLELLNRFPEIKNVSVTLPIVGHEPQIYIEPYRPSFILTTTSSNAFLLDTTGRALATTSQIANIEQLRLPTIEDKTGIDVKLGSRALPSTTVLFAQTILAALDAEDVSVTSLVLPPAAYELDVYIAETPYYVKFNLQNDPLQQAGTYLATRQRLTTDKVTPGQYIDVRVPERAYYK